MKELILFRKLLTIYITFTLLSKFLFTVVNIAKKKSNYIPT